MPLEAVLAGTDPNATSGLVVCEFTTTVLGRVVTGFVTVADPRGHVSNALSFSLPAERRRVGAAAATARVGILRVTQGAVGGSFV